MKKFPAKTEAASDMENDGGLKNPMNGSHFFDRGDAASIYHLIFGIWGFCE